MQIEIKVKVVGSPGYVSFTVEPLEFDYDQIIYFGYTHYAILDEAQTERLLSYPLRSSAPVFLTSCGLGDDFNNLAKVFFNLSSGV